MRTIHLDESGFTGSDLNSGDQPVFTIASHDFSEIESRELRAEFFADVKAKDLKHKSLKGRPRQQQMVVRFLQAMQQRPGHFRVAILHKRFGLLCKAIDWIVEPVMHRDGVDLYDRGGNLAMANMLHMMLTSLAPEFYDELLVELQRFLTDPNDENHEELGGLLVSKSYLPGDTKEHPPLADALTHLAWPLMGLMPVDRARIAKNKLLEVALSMALTLAAGWRRALGEEFEIVHDATSNMSRRKDYWDALVAPTAPEALVGYDRRTMQFPIGVARTRFLASEESIGIQLADVIAGAFAEWGRWMADSNATKTEYVERLDEDLKDWVFSERIWPDAKWSPQDLGTTGPNRDDPLDYLGQFGGPG